MLTRAKKQCILKTYFVGAVVKKTCNFPQFCVKLIYVWALVYYVHCKSPKG